MLTRKEKLLKKSANFRMSCKFSGFIKHMVGYKAGKLLTMGFNPVDLNKKIVDIKLENLQ
jgi:hypothetical protein